MTSSVAKINHLPYKGRNSSKNWKFPRGWILEFVHLDYPVMHGRKYAYNHGA